MMIRILPLIFLSLCCAAQKNFNILDFGALPDGITSNTKAIQKAVKACSKSGGGMVLIPQGNFVTGSVQLFSDINVHFSAGAKLLGVKDNNEYLHQKDFGFSGMGAGNKTGMLFAVNAENISITGHGIMDGQGDFSVYSDSLQQGSGLDNKYTRQGAEYMKSKGMEDGPVMWKGSYEERPGIMLIFSNCKNVSLSDITIKESPNWTVVFYKCDDIKVKGITIKNNLLIPNSDGLDFYDSKNAVVSDCRIDAGDDAMAIGYSDNINVSNCILRSRSCGIRIGYNGFDDSETRGNLLFNNIRIFDSNRGIGIFQRKKGDMENIHFSNIIIQTRLHSGQWWGHGEPIHISSVPGIGAEEAGVIKNVTFNNVTATAEEGIVLYGSPKSILEGIKFNNVSLKIKNGPLVKYYGGNFDLRPTNDVSIGIFKHDIPAVYAGYVKNLYFNNFSVTWDNSLPNYFTHAIFSENFENLFIRDFSGSANPSIKAPSIFLKNGKAFYGNSVTDAGLPTIEKQNVRP